MAEKLRGIWNWVFEGYQHAYDSSDFSNFNTTEHPCSCSEPCSLCSYTPSDSEQEDGSEYENIDVSPENTPQDIEFILPVETTPTEALIETTPSNASAYNQQDKRDGINFQYIPSQNSNSEEVSDVSESTPDSETTPMSELASESENTESNITVSEVIYRPPYNFRKRRCINYDETPRKSPQKALRMTC